MPHPASLPLPLRQRVLAALAQPGATLTAVARLFQLSRPTVRRWRDRYRQQGAAGLHDRSRAPKTSPQRLPAPWHEELLALRRAHPHWGARKLRCLLQERHPRKRRLPSLRSLERWLQQAALTKTRPARARRGPEIPRPPLTQAQRPNQVWTLDFKGWFRTADGQRCEALTVRDLATRFILCIRPVPQLSDRCVRPLLRALFQRYGCPRVIRTDNGAPFAGQGPLNLTTLSVWWLRSGIRVEFTRPAKPQDNGGHEQMHRVLKAETASPPAPTARAQQRRFQRWLREYNELRPHAALHDRRPAERYRPSTRLWAEPGPCRYPATWLTRRVRNRGSIKIYGRLRFIGRAFVHQTVGLKRIDSEHDGIYLGALLIGTLYRGDPGGMRPCAYRPKPAQAPETTVAAA